LSRRLADIPASRAGSPEPPYENACNRENPMSDDQPTPETEPRPETEGVEEARPEAEAAETVDPVEALTVENAELRDRLLRMAAEMENLRKRTEREIADARAYAIAGFARDMLSATDSLSRALMVVPAEARQAADGTLRSLIEGIELAEREMQRLLGKHGVTPIEAEGQKFDPHKHQAMFEVPDPTRPEGTVVQVVQAGYAIGERVLRPAMVGVSKGGTAAPAGEPSAEGQGIDKQA
jgi:molecular chaperone GrpE